MSSRDDDNVFDDINVSSIKTANIVLVLWSEGPYCNDSLKTTPQGHILGYCYKVSPEIEKFIMLG